MQLSSLSSMEYADIVGEYNYHIYGSSMDPEIFERGYSEAQLEILKERIIKENAATHA